MTLSAAAGGGTLRFMPRMATVLLASAAMAASAQDVPDSRVELVRLDVVVTDKQGQLVRGLGQADFVVLEDGKPQRLTHFVAAGRTPRRPRLRCPARRKCRPRFRCPPPPARPAPS